MSAHEFDVIIVGSGISGIGTACHLKMDAPWASFAILEGRESIGGTWDVFRYPGIRSDSDMHTLGFRFKPWNNEKSIADAPAIMEYLHETVAEYGLEPTIRYGHKVEHIAWDSVDARWTLRVRRGTGDLTEFRCRFVQMCTGYYSYTEPYQPDFPGKADFNGPFFHPQFWPEGLDFKGKRAVVIGSGATAVTIIPAMAEQGAGHVTMLQRSPTWFISRPAKDRFANTLRKLLPNRIAYAVTRFKNIGMQQLLFNQTQKNPERARNRLLKLTAAKLPDGYDVATHFTPRYNPWQQRLCLVPDSDFFNAIKAGKADIVTDEIEKIVPDGIRLKSGEELKADIIISATGLKMEIMCGITISIDGESRRIGEAYSYKGCMFSDMPNIAATFGYSNASWTLKADLISQYVCRLLNHLHDSGTDVVVPEPHDVCEDEAGMMNLTSGYVQRARGLVPKQGDRDPWIVHHNYPADKKLMRHGALEDGALTFYRAADYAVKQGVTGQDQDEPLAVAAE